MVSNDPMEFSDGDIVTDKPTGIKIKGEAKRQLNQKQKEVHEIQKSIKLFLESKRRITYHQKRRQDLLEQNIFPHIQKEFKMIYLLDQDKTSNIIRKKAYIRKLFKDKNDAISFYKKHSHLFK